MPNEERVSGERNNFSILNKILINCLYIEYFDNIGNAGNVSPNEPRPKEEIVSESESEYSFEGVDMKKRSSMNVLNQSRKIKIKKRNNP